jgi:cell division protein FtsN
MKEQRSGILLGFIIGVVVGLAVALIVAMYVSKVPVPFFNKSQTRTPEQDAAEQKKNKDWDPNAPLQGKSTSKPGAGTTGSTTASPAGPAVTKPLAKPAVTADPLGDLAKAKGAAATPEPFSYFVQVGAFRTPEDAESQRARLSLTGVEAKVTDREQAGRTVYRVRVGPFEHKDEAESTKRKLDAAGYETALVRQQR